MINSELTKSLSLQAGLRAEQTNNLKGWIEKGINWPSKIVWTLSDINLNQKGFERLHAISTVWDMAVALTDQAMMCQYFQKIFSPQSYVAEVATICHRSITRLVWPIRLKDKYSFFKLCIINQFSTEVLMLTQSWFQVVVSFVSRWKISMAKLAGGVLMPRVPF